MIDCLGKLKSNSEPKRRHENEKCTARLQAALRVYFCTQSDDRTVRDEQVLTSVILLAFAILVFGGCCCLIGEFVVDCMNETDPTIIFGFLAIGLLAILAWLAGLGALELLASLFLWQVGESALIWIASVVVLLWGGFYYTHQ